MTFSTDIVGYAQESVTLEWETRLEPTSTAAQLAWPDGVMEELNAESAWKEVKGKEAQLVNDDPAENWRSNGKARLVPTSNSCSDSRMINFAAARTCISADAWQWDALVMATVTVLLPNKDPDTELIPSWLVVEMEVLEEDQVRGLSPPVSVCFTV